jgi:hypothetical protein
MRIIANEIVDIETVRERAARLVTIRLALPPHGRATLEALTDVLARHKGDRRVCLELELRGRKPALRVKADILGQVRVRPSAQLVAEVERLCGPGTIVLS